MSVETKCTESSPSTIVYSTTTVDGEFEMIGNKSIDDKKEGETIEVLSKDAKSSDDTHNVSVEEDSPYACRRFIAHMSAKKYLLERKANCNKEVCENILNMKDIKLVHPFTINNEVIEQNVFSASNKMDAPEMDAQEKENIRQKTYIKYQTMRELLNSSVVSGMVKPFGGSVRDQILHGTQVSYHMNNEGDVPNEAYVCPKDFDVLACEEDGSYTKGYYQGNVSAHAYHSLVKKAYGELNVSDIYLSKNGYNSCWVWFFLIKIRGHMPIRIEVVSFKKADEIQADNNKIFNENELTKSVCNTWDLDVNALVLGKDGHILHPLYLCDMIDKSPLMVEYHKNAIKKNIAKKLFTINPKCFDNTYVLERVKKMLIRGWTAKISAVLQFTSRTYYVRHYMFEVVVAFSEEDWKERVIEAGIETFHPPTFFGTINEVMKQINQ